MSAKGGDIKEITYTHPTLGSGVLFAKANEGNKLTPGGLVASDDDGMIDGAGNYIWQMNWQRGSIEALIVNDMNTREDLTKLQAMEGDPVDTEFTVSIVNNTVWSGIGRPVGMLSADINASTVSVKIAANFKKQV